MFENITNQAHHMSLSYTLFYIFIRFRPAKLRNIYVIPQTITKKIHNIDKKALHAWACRADDSCVLPAFMRYQSGERP